MSDREVVYKLRVENLGSSVLMKMSKDADKLNVSVGKFSGKFESSTRSLNQLNSVLDRTKSLYNNATDPQKMKVYAEMINRVKERMSDLEKTTKSCSDKTGGFFTKLQDGLGISKGFIGVAGTMAALRFAYGIGADASKAASEVEKYNTTLKVMLGSSSAARDRMQEYVSIAKKTPFELRDVVNGGNQLQAIGRYSAQNLTMLGDLASAAGKPIEQVMNAYSKLATGQKGEGVNMFRDLLISVDDWTKATGKGVSKNGELLATTEEMIKVLPGIMKAKGFFGMMQNQSETTEGKMSNLKDSVFQLKVALGEQLNPTVNKFTKISTGAVDKLKEWVGIPIEQKIAKEKTEVNFLMQKLIEMQPHQEGRKELIDEINRKYPELLKNLNLESNAQDTLRKRLAEVNAEYDKKMRKAAFQRMIEKLDVEAGDEMDEATKYEMSIMARNNRPKIVDKIKSRFGTDAFVANGKLFSGPLGKAVPYDLENADPQFASAAYQLIAELEENDKLISYWQNDVEGRKKAMNSYNRLKLRRNAMEKALGLDENKADTSGNNTSGNNPAAGGSGQNLSNGLSSTASEIAGGGSRQTNINIHVNKEMIGHITINPITMTQGTNEVRDLILQSLSQLMLSTNKMALE